jgi:hypothetical protein
LIGIIEAYERKSGDKEDAAEKREKPVYGSPWAVHEDQAAEGQADKRRK